MIEHEGQHVDFSMKVLESFQSAMARQVNEGVRIKRSKAYCVMNSTLLRNHIQLERSGTTFEWPKVVSEVSFLRFWGVLWGGLFSGIF